MFLAMVEPTQHHGVRVQAEHLGEEEGSGSLSRAVFKCVHDVAPLPPLHAEHAHAEDVAIVTEKPPPPGCSVSRRPIVLTLRRLSSIWSLVENSPSSSPFRAASFWRSPPRPPRRGKGVLHSISLHSHFVSSLSL